VNRALVIAVVGAIVLAAALLLNFYLGRDERTVATAPIPPAPATGVTTPGAASKAPGAPAIAPRSNEPSFDIVRVNPDGNAVIAGRAPAGAEVTVMDGDQVTGKVVADQRGEWVLVPTKPLSPGSRNLSLSVKLPDGSTATSKSDVVLVVPERGDAGALALRVERGEGLSPSTLLQSPGSTKAAGTLGIDVIDYDGEGRVSINGTAKPGATLRIYVDNRAAGEAVADAKGQWNFRLKDMLPPGDYSLRVDETDGGGRVARRIEVPFNRAPAIGALGDKQIVVVRPGNSLWRIARRTYGKGVQYTLIFEANKAQIRDPNLIYPGQVFALPRGGN
jgi:hypothetical protein